MSKFIILGFFQSLKLKFVQIFKEFVQIFKNRKVILSIQKAAPDISEISSKDPLW